MQSEYYKSLTSRVISLGKLNKHTYGYQNIELFAPHGGVLVKAPGVKGVIATISAAQYLELVRESIEELATNNAEFFAEAVSTSVKYAEIATLKLFDTLRWQEELLASAREVVVGVVADKNGEVYATGRRSVKRKKSSVVAKIRSMLPVGTMSLYKTGYDAVLYKVPYLQEHEIERRMCSVGELMEKKKPPKNYVIIMDSAHYRAYAGRTLLANKVRWNDWKSLYNVPDDVSVILCNGNSWNEFTVDELCEAGHHALYQDQPATPDLEAVMEIVETLAGRPENLAGFVVTIYMTDYSNGYYDFCKSMNQFLDSCEHALVVLKRFGYGGGESLRRVQWGIGYNHGPKVVYVEANYRLADLMMSLDNEWPAFICGVGVGDVEVYKVTRDSSIEQIAKERKISPGQILVGDVPGKNLPPHLHTVKGIAFLSTRKSPYAGRIASAPGSATKEFKAGTKLYKLAGELSSLLANQ